MQRTDNMSLSQEDRKDEATRGTNFGVCCRRPRRLRGLVQGSKSLIRTVPPKPILTCVCRASAVHDQFENVAIETPFEAAIACSLTIHSLLLRMTRITNRVCSALGSNYSLFEHALHDKDSPSSR